MNMLPFSRFVQEAENRTGILPNVDLTGAWDELKIQNEVDNEHGRSEICMIQDAASMAQEHNIPTVVGEMIEFV